MGYTTAAAVTTQGIIDTYKYNQKESPIAVSRLTLEGISARGRQTYCTLTFMLLYNKVYFVQYMPLLYTSELLAALCMSQNIKGVCLFAYIQCLIVWLCFSSLTASSRVIESISPVTWTTRRVGSGRGRGGITLLKRAWHGHQDALYLYDDRKQWARKGLDEPWESGSCNLSPII